MDIHQSQVNRNMGGLGQWTFISPRYTGTWGHGHSSVPGRQEHGGMGIHQSQVDRNMGACMDNGHSSVPGGQEHGVMDIHQSQVDRNMGAWAFISPR
jgi:hypothetical protein